MSYFFEDYCVGGILLLDGGMGQELRRRSKNRPTPLWSAQALLDEPELVQTIHEEYIQAGAKVITTNTYITVRHRLQRDAGLGDKFEELNQLAGKLAVQARDSAGESVLIAGSLPPLFGSYRPDQVRPVPELQAIYREHVEILNPYVDLFLCETLSTPEESFAAASVAGETGKPVWVSWTLQDNETTRLRGGASLTDAFQQLSNLSVEAVLVNCCAPESITAAMPELVKLNTSIKVGGYANGFEHIPEQWSISDGISALGKRRDLDPESYSTHAEAWIDAGATVVGGCCETGPAHIQQISESLKRKAK
ncbi:MAG: homocysteine S-methyltransferase family protein [Cyanobacteria bacterium P01_D01_bin.56]